MLIRRCFALSLLLFSCGSVSAVAVGAEDGSPPPSKGSGTYFADSVPGGEVQQQAAQVAIVGSASAAAAEVATTDATIADSYGAAATVTDAVLAAGDPCPPAKMAALKKQVAGAYKPLFYDNNFNYLCDPCYDDFHLGEGLKRNCLGNWGVLDIGGQYRARLHNERNMRGLGLTGRDDDFLLHRTRLFANWEVSDRFRFYGEYIDAESNYENFPPRNIEVNRSDMQNLFADAKLMERDSGDLWCRVGRQELLYGSQRLISPLDWANTRRTFEGVKAFWKGTDWDIDAFWTRPVIIDPKQFDSADQSQEFYGLFATYKGTPNRTSNLYALRYIETDATSFEFNTFGANLQGTEGDWLWDLEGAYQTGRFGALDHNVGFFTIGGGKKFDQYDWKPVLWAYYDWSAGSNQLRNGFHHLFPLGHKYMGFMDLYGRRNLEDANFSLTFKPHEKLTVLAWHHIFFLQNGNDVPYNINMTPFVNTAGGKQYLGQELDLLLTWQFHPRQDLTLGYSHFWHGSFYDTNPAVPFRGDADFFYTQYTINF